MSKLRLLTINKYNKDRVNANLFDGGEYYYTGDLSLGNYWGSLLADAAALDWGNMWNHDSRTPSDYLIQSSQTPILGNGNPPYKAASTFTGGWDNNGWNAPQTSGTTEEAKSLDSSKPNTPMGTLTKMIHQAGTAVTNLSLGFSKMKDASWEFNNIGGNNTASNMYDMGGWTQLAGDSIKHVSQAIGDIRAPKLKYNVLRNNILSNAKTGVAASTTDLLLNAYDSFNPMAKTKLKNWWQGTGATVGKSIGLGLEGSASGLQAGGAVGAIIGGVMGTATGVLGGLLQRRKALKYVDKTNSLISAVNSRNYSILNNKATSLDRSNMRNQLKMISAYGGPINGALDYDLANTLLLNYADRTNSYSKITNPYFSGYTPLLTFAFGGNLDTLGASFSNGYTYIGNGGSHEENPNAGILVGIDLNGTPNLVEEGEVVWDNYVFSNRLTIPKDLKKALGIRGKKVTYADAAQLLTKEGVERPNDPISSLGQDDSLSKLREGQEVVRLRKQAQEMKLQIDLMPPEQLAALQLQMTAPLQLVPPQQEIVPQELQPLSQEEMAALELALLGNGGYAYGGNLYSLGGTELLDKDTKNSTPDDNESVLVLKNADPNSRPKYEDFVKWYKQNYGTEGMETEQAYLSTNPSEIVRDYLQEVEKTKIKDKDVTATSGEVLNKFQAFAPKRFYRIFDLNGTFLQEIPIAKTSKDREKQRKMLLKDFGVDLKTIPTEPSETILNTELLIEDPDNKGKFIVDPASYNYFNVVGNIPYNLSVPELKKKQQKTKDRDISFTKFSIPMPDNTLLRYAPAFNSGLQTLTDILGLTNKFEGTQGTALRQSLGRLRDIEATPAGLKLAYNPTSKWEAITALNSQYAGQRAALANAGNRVSTQSGTLLNSLTLNEELGKLLAAIDDTNQTKLEKITAANNALDEEFAKRVDAASAANLLQDRVRAEILGKAAAADDEESTLLSKTKSQNRNDFFKSLGNIGKENFSMNELSNLIKSGALGTLSFSPTWWTPLEYQDYRNSITQSYTLGVHKYGGNINNGKKKGKGRRGLTY